MIEVALADPPRPGFRLDVAFSAPMHGVTALLGPSGSGKTSVLRALAGLDRRPGRVRFGDDVWQDGARFVAAHRRHVGYVAQGVSLLPHLSVAGNLDYAARRNPAGPFERGDIIARTGIAALLDRKPEKLSGGEGQRAAIARALMGQPQLLLMDEPLSGLDSEARADLLKALRKLLEGIDIPVFYVTHDHHEAEALATTFIRLRGGQLDTA